MDRNLVAIVALAFVAVAAVVFVVAQTVIARSQLQRRLPAAASSARFSTGSSGGGLGALVAEHFTEERFGVDSAMHSRLRRDLLRAGYFGNSSVNYYIFARMCTVVVLPLVIFFLTRVFLPTLPKIATLLIVAIAVAIGILGPDAWLSRRRNQKVLEYRRIFPDLLDLLVVCVGAGLSVEAAFERVRGEVEKSSRSMGINLQMMGAEMRAGRGTVEALNSLADRLALDEAASFVSVLRHSVELGGDVGDALRVFADEMRFKRLIRAEEQANKLPVKMIAPLAMFIFPVILVLALLPVALKLSLVFQQVG